MNPDVQLMISAIIDRASIPGRQHEPRLAAELVNAERVQVRTPHGDVAAWRVGEGPAVLLVHGWRDTARLWDPLMTALRARNRAFVALDLPGHGFSEGERCLTPEVPDAVLAVSAALGPVDAAVAHSFATGGTSRAVAEGLPVDRLVLIAPPLAYRSPDGATAESRDGGSQRWRRIAGELGFDPDLGDRARATYLASLDPSRAAWNFTDGLAALDCEILLVASVDDDRFDIAPARELAVRLPRCSFEELRGLDHRASARDDAAVETMVEFLEHRAERSQR